MFLTANYFLFIDILFFNVMLLHSNMRFGIVLISLPSFLPSSPSYLTLSCHPLICLILSSSFSFLFFSYRARGERALIMYTIEAVRDMSFEILRTEKDMATHKKYVLGNLYIHTFLLWLFLSSLYRITATLEWVTTVFSVCVSSLSLLQCRYAFLSSPPCMVIP